MKTWTHVEGKLSKIFGNIQYNYYAIFLQGKYVWKHKYWRLNKQRKETNYETDLIFKRKHMSGPVIEHTGRAMYTFFSFTILQKS